MNTLLDERRKRYGHFGTNAYFAQKCKAVARQMDGWGDLPPYMQEATDMILSKLSRMLTGDPFYDDNWVDIKGYAERVLEEIQDAGPSRPSTHP